ncbi:PaaI family thioesterase [Dietzia sp.]|uniref:PaaI family thioesterase n=1 Tax=Dietzia sp. TaxID=1871616 RepID=UPI002FDB3A34
MSGESQNTENTDLPDVSLESASAFVAASGFVVESVDARSCRGYVELGEDHFTPWGVVHGGVYATIIESAASIGASAAVRDRGQFAVGLHNGTDFLRPSTGGVADVAAEPLHQGKGQQLWDVVISARDTGKPIARGQVRLQNVPLTES